VKIVKPAKVPVLTRVIERAHRPQLHVAAMFGFPLSAPRALIDEVTFWAQTTAALGENAVLDEGLAKARGEVLVAGSFFAPEGKALTASFVRAKVGAVDKRVAVVGNRVWRDKVPSAPEPMTTMPIDWAHAFGGAKYDKNPFGKGAEPIDVDGQPVWPLPNVETYGALLRSPASTPEPAAFLPMSVLFAQRKKRAGTFDKRWFEEHFPGMPLDTDPMFWNVALEDQWAAGFFRGDEEILIENMHPAMPRIESRLPGLTARCFVKHREGGNPRFVEIALSCDTVWLLPSVDMGVVVLHGARTVNEDDGADVTHLLCACEEPGAPRSMEYYGEVLARRLDKDRGPFLAISDSDLMPARSSGVVANLGESVMGRWTKSQGLLARNMRRASFPEPEGLRAEIAAEGLDPAAIGLDRAPEPEAFVGPPMDDPDAMIVYVDAQIAAIEAKKREVAAQHAVMEADARKAYAETGEDYDEAMARGAKEAAGPPKFSAAGHLATLRTMADEAREEGVPLEDVERKLEDPAYEDEVIGQERALLDMYRRHAHLYPVAAAALDAGGSERVRTLVGIAIESRESLSERDLTGADLSGMKLAGIDFSRALLESADLSGCDLSGANLDGAVLAKANLRGANLTNARLSGTNLGGAVLRDAVLVNADMTDVVMMRADLAGADLTGANLDGASWLEVKGGPVNFSRVAFGECNFIKADFGGARFGGADLSGANFVECSLDGADFAGATMVKTAFVASRGERVSFRDAHLAQGVFAHGSSFADADFTGADMERANLRGTLLIGARFDHANLAGADLSECDASGATFERANLKGALLIRTKLVEGQLAGANLMDVLASKAIIAGASFAGANLYRADLSRVVGDARTSFADAEVAQVRVLPKAAPPKANAKGSAT